MGMGSMIGAQRLRHFSVLNVTAEMADTAGRPVLPIRTESDWEGNE